MILEICVKLLLLDHTSPLVQTLNHLEILSSNSFQFLFTDTFIEALRLAAHRSLALTTVWVACRDRRLKYRVS